MAEAAPALAGASAGRTIRIREAPAVTIHQVSAFHGSIDAVADALGGACGVDTPRQVGETATGGDAVILCIGPGRWWVVGAAHGLDLDPAHGAVVDQSHGRVVLEVVGPAVRDLLAKGTAVDLHPAAMPPGRCASTALGHVAALLHVREGDRFDVHVARSYAHTLFEWLEDAALEFEQSTQS